jgi:hypothetical protein
METIFLVLFIISLAQVFGGERNFSRFTVLPVFLIAWLGTWYLVGGEWGRMLGLNLAVIKSLATAIRLAYHIKANTHPNSPQHLKAIYLESFTSGAVFILLVKFYT